jgi:hypothetical protein
MIKLKCQKFLIFFFINVAKDIGSSNIKSDKSHPSISFSSLQLSSKEQFDIHIQNEKADK